MSENPNGKCKLVWAGGEDEFCVARTGDIFALEEKCNAGMSEVANRLSNGTWRYNDIRETIRIGLIGGGKTPEQAMVAVKRYVDPDPDDLNRNPLSRSVMLAYAILAATLVGVPGDQPGKKQEAERDVPSTDETAASSVPQSSPQAQASTGHPEKQSDAPSGKSRRQSTATMPRMAGNQI